jgi:hypothetical protein
VIKEVADWLGDEETRATLTTGAIGFVSLILGHLLTRSSERRQARAVLCAEAFKTAIAWREMIYRVRRRSGEPTEDRALIERFHKLQEDIDFHEGWIGAESVWLGRSYSLLVKSVKLECRDLIDEAWRSELRKPVDGTPKADKHPAIEEACRRFLFDVRAHLAPICFPWLKIALWLRNVHWKHKS